MINYNVESGFVLLEVILLFNSNFSMSSSISTARSHSNKPQQHLTSLHLDLSKYLTTTPRKAKPIVETVMKNALSNVSSIILYHMLLFFLCEKALNEMRYRP
jgi:hypothetical protein